MTASGRFAGRTVLVTGASGGMGYATAKAFADEGAFVALNDLPGGQLERAIASLADAAGGAAAFPADVSVEGEVNGMVKKVLEHRPTVDILVNNAGVLRSTPVEEIPSDEWDWVLGVNLKGVFLCTRAVLPVMKANRWGRIINISSSAGRSTSELGGAHYTASKAGVLGLTRHTARDYAAFGITANAICPGLIETAMIRDTLDQQRLARFIGQIPVGRAGTPEEEAALVLFLASDEARFITGATIDLNGGSLML